jgi:glyoxylase-like metal-dependent hydrolase (beta-lactamase superfamily II)/rhodanese-related sulfurtransferase
MQVQHFFDPATYTLTYVVFDDHTGDAVVIDPVLDFDPLAVTTSTASNDAVVAFVEARGLVVHLILETHAHADHLSGSQDLRRRLGGKIVIGESIREVQEVFKGVFGLDDLATDGSQFDELIADGDHLQAGTLVIEAIHTPGHTPACMTYRIDDAVFTGDALFMPDFGTGRCDFPAGSAETLYDSIHNRLYALPDHTRVFVGHDYQPGGRELAFETTIGASKATNKHLRAETDAASFVAFRTARDATLSPPKLLFQSVQVNIDAGRLPGADGSGRRFLKLPLTSSDPWDAVGASDAGVPRVDADWVQAHAAGARLIDVRQPEEFDGPLGHIDGAELVPLSTLDAVCKDWSKDEPLVLICRSSGRSDRATQALAARGFRRVASMAGGMLGWNGPRA